MTTLTQDVDGDMNASYQWAKEVRGFSSQYNDSTWSAHRVVGSPTVYPRYGDIHGAWAQQWPPKADEYIEVPTV